MLILLFPYFIAFEEFQEVVNIKKKFSLEEITKLFNAVDANNNGQIDYSGMKFIKLSIEKMRKIKRKRISDQFVN